MSYVGNVPAGATVRPVAVPPSDQNGMAVPVEGGKRRTASSASEPVRWRRRSTRAQDELLRSRADEFRQMGIGRVPEECMRFLADFTALTDCHVFHPDAEPLSEAQSIAVGRWVHALADEIFRKDAP